MITGHVYCDFSYICIKKIQCIPKYMFIHRMITKMSHMTIKFSNSTADSQKCQNNN